MNKITVGIIFALDVEFEKFASMATFAKVEKHLCYEFHIGSSDKYDVVCVKCGLGKTNAGAVTTLLVDHYSPNLIINSGVGGAINRKLKQIDTVIGTKCVYLDVDMTTDESTDLAFGQMQGLPRVFPLDKEIEMTLPKFLTNVHYLTIGTSDCFVTDYNKIKHLCDEHFADLDVSVCDMESTAVSQIGFINHIPVIIIRTISDVVGNNGDYTNFAERAAQASANVVQSILNNIERIIFED